jgi:hypothetical protein
LFTIGRRVGALEGQVRLDLGAHLLHPALDRVEGVEGALARLLGVADHAGRTADEDVRRVSRELEPLGGEDLDQAAHVQAGRGRVEAHVVADAALGEGRAQGIRVGRVRDEAAPFEVVPQVGVGVHGT